jgi:hypothetical protein
MLRSLAACYQGVFYRAQGAMFYFEFGAEEPAREIPLYGYHAMTCDPLAALPTVYAGGYWGPVWSKWEAQSYNALVQVVGPIRNTGTAQAPHMIRQRDFEHGFDVAGSRIILSGTSPSTFLNNPDTEAGALERGSLTWLHTETWSNVNPDLSGSTRFYRSDSGHDGDETDDGSVDVDNLFAQGVECIAEGSIPGEFFVGTAWQRRNIAGDKERFGDIYRVLIGSDSLLEIERLFSGNNLIGSHVLDLAYNDGFVCWSDYEALRIMDVTDGSIHFIQYDDFDDNDHPEEPYSGIWNFGFLHAYGDGFILSDYGDPKLDIRYIHKEGGDLTFIDRLPVGMAREKVRPASASDLVGHRLYIAADADLEIDDFYYPSIVRIQLPGSAYLVGNSPDCDFQSLAALQQELEHQAEVAPQLFPEEMTISILKAEQPYEVPDLNFDFSTYSPRLQQISLRGVQPSLIDESVYVAADPGAVVLDALSLPFSLRVGTSQSLTLENFTLRDAIATDIPRGGGMISSTGGAITIQNCQFENVHHTAPERSVIHLAGSGNPSGLLTIESSCFVDCSGSGAAMISAEGTTCALVGSTFHNCLGTNSPVVTQTVGTLSLGNILFTGNSDPNAPVFSAPGASVEYCLFDSYDWASTQAAITDPQNANQLLQPEEMAGFVRYISTEGPDYDLRLRHDSQCLDIGDPSPDRRDFDLTRSDIGWMPKYVVQTLSSNVHSTPPAGFYDVAGDLTTDCDIEAGTVLRVSSGISLTLNCDLEDLILTIGDASGPRTAIVGRPDVVPHQAPASSVIIDSNDSGIGLLVLEGVLFNYPPKNGDDSELKIEDWHQNDAGLALDGNLVQFKNYINPPHPSGTPSYDGGLRLKKCNGWVSGLDVGSDSGPGHLSLVSCDLDVENCSFVNTTSDSEDETPCLAVFGLETGGNLLFRDNLFDGDAQVKPMVDLVQCSVRMERNRFLDCKTVALIETHSSIDMSYEARNDLRAGPDFSPLKPLLAMESGNLDLYCGRNNFIVYEYNIDLPIVTWFQSPDDLQPTPFQIWRENFWGLSCDVDFSEEDVNNPEWGWIPTWATAEDNLTHCVEPLDPANPACPFEENSASELLKYGKTAESEGNYALAQDNFCFLLFLHPLSNEAKEGTLRLKALGLHKNYGPSAYTSIHDDLFAAADTSEAMSFHSQAVLQDCGGWCVMGRWGDRIVAVSGLNDMLSIELDPLCVDTINRALLEIASYPIEGGLSGANPEAMAQQSLIQYQAIDALLSYKRGSGGLTGSMTLPQDFAINRIYPNPFNPTTTIELALPVDGHVRLRMYNLLGQMVEELVNEDFQAGLHKVVFNGSPYSSGMYFAVAECRGEVMVKKMMLLK